MSLVGKEVGGKYRVVREAGEGGMSAVYEVEHLSLPKRFAMKVLHRELATAEDAIARFRREAEIIASLDHPNLVQIMDWGTLEDGGNYFVMELLEGEDLDQRLQRVGPLPWPEIEEIARQSFGALLEAHRKGVVHRDLKPTNIFLLDREGGLQVKLIDFGLSRAVDSVAITLYSDPQLIGTPAYMSPEQLGAREAPGQEADTWAMAVMLYEISSGRLPFEGHLGAILHTVGKEEPPPLATLRADTPPAFADAIAAALSPDAGCRLRSSSELAERVSAALKSHRGMVSSAPLPVRTIAAGGITAGEARAAETPAGRDRATVLERPAPARPERAEASGSAPAPAAAPARPERAEASPRAPAPVLGPASPAPPRAPRRTRWGAVAVAGLLIAGGVALALMLTAESGGSQQRQEVAAAPPPDSSPPVAANDPVFDASPAEPVAESAPERPDSESRAASGSKSVSRPEESSGGRKSPADKPLAGAGSGDAIADDKPQLPTFVLRPGDRDKPRGIVIVESKPKGAAVHIGGDVIASTPLRLRAVVGELEVEVKKRAYKDVRRTIRVEADTLHTLYFVLEKQKKGADKKERAENPVPPSDAPPEPGDSEEPAATEDDPEEPAATEDDSDEPERPIL